MNTQQTIHEIFRDAVKRGVIRIVPTEVANSLKERFISFYSQYDSRLKKINRNRIRCYYNAEGFVECTAAYHNKAYRQVYKEF